jgi:TolB-like protein/Tfp pilus assembly protein PilF
MPDSATSPGQMSEPPANEPRLESWGEIAGYLRRDVRTVQRWERYHGLPVRRLRVGKLPTVYAYRSELDKWFLEHQPKPEADDPHDESFPGEDLSAEPTGSPHGDESGGNAFLESFGLRKGILAGLILLMLGGGTYLFLVYKPRLPGRIPEKNRLFVRPFANSSGNSQQDEFIAGLTNETITQLGRIDPSQLGVIAPTSSTLLATKSIGELGRLLNVQYVLEGSVSRSGNQVRIDAQLISVNDQTHVWSESYKNDLSDILRVQDEVARAVAQAIRTKIPGVASGLPKSPNAKRVDPEAYDAYLKGRLYWANRDLLRSLNAYQQALQKDPEYALARTGLASAYLLLGQAPNDAMPPNEAMPKARDAAQRALLADPTIPEAHCVLANIAATYDWNFDAAEREYQRAISMDPSNPTAHYWYSQVLTMRNRLPEAQREMSLVLDLDPVAPTIRAENFYYARDYDSEIAQARHTLEQYPTFMLARFWLASGYREKKMYPEAIQEFQQVLKQAGDNPAMLTVYGHALAVSGDKTGARKVLAELHGLAQTRYVPAVYFAVMHVGLGEYDTAFKWFDKALQERNDRLVYLAVDPLADPLRSDRRFPNLLTRIGLPLTAIQSR